jgi:hypothetical protein
MSTVILLLALTALGAGLVRYARHDRFSGPHPLRDLRDECQRRNDLRLAHDLSRFVPR